MRKIVHLIPYNGIGGVELAANSMARWSNDRIDFKVEFVFKNIKTQRQRYRTFNIIRILYQARHYARSDIDALIVSLWKAYIVGALVKLTRPKVKLVVFLHCATNQHVIDKLATRVAIFLADEVWTDSDATKSVRSTLRLAENARVLSSVISHLEPLPLGRLEPSFIFWGRLSAQKGIDRALRVFAAVRAKHPSARFSIIGPDGGSLRVLMELCDEMRLNEAVMFLGAASRDEILSYARQASFYLQTSLHEGMAFSVVEAMQLGLVPVVTAVGEIRAYCHNGQNAVRIETDEQAVKDVLRVLESNSRYEELRSGAIATWREHPLYRDSVLSACEALFSES
jgi:glycosyltransferase involved in cell wall biosynthesis